jgi:hypothetical protein
MNHNKEEKKRRMREKKKHSYLCNNMSGRSCQNTLGQQLMAD